MHTTSTLARRALTALVVVGGLTGAGSAFAQPASVAPGAREIDAAHAAYEHDHWLEAYTAFTRLADRGDPGAARIARLMHRYGPQLYGQRFEATPYQELFWGWLQHCVGGCGAPEHVEVAPSGC